MTLADRKPNLDHPALPLLKEALPDARLFATEFRGQTTLVAARDSLHEAMAFLKNDERCRFDFLSDIVGVDYLGYPQSRHGGPWGRFGVIYNLVSYHNPLQASRLFIKVLLDPTMETKGTADDPALHLESVTDLWPGAEWLEREVFDMLGIRFDHHPDLRRILLWQDYPAHPHRKDYPVRGRGEREHYQTLNREQV